MKKIILFLIILAVGLFLILKKDKKEETPVLETGASGQFAKLSEDAIVVLEQLPGDVVYINAVNFSDNGFVIIKKDDGGASGKIIGVSEFLVKGSYSNIDVSTTESMSSGLSYYGYTYIDNGDGIFDPKTDKEKMFMSFMVNKDAQDPRTIQINY